MSVAFSVDNRQIVSGSRDKTVKLWNTLVSYTHLTKLSPLLLVVHSGSRYPLFNPVYLSTSLKQGECKFTITDEGHSEWVSCVRFSPSPTAPVIVSCGWDKRVKVWNLANCKLKQNLIGHTGYLNVVTVSPDGSLCASGGKDGTAMLWDLNEGKRLYSLDAGDIIHSLVFSPNRYWLCAATSQGIKIWDLESKDMVDILCPKWPTQGKHSLAPLPYCTSLAWSADGQTLFSGYTDGKIRCWSVN